MKSKKLKKSISYLLLASFSMVSCKSGPSPKSAEIAGGDLVLMNLKDAPKGIDLRLSSGRQGNQAGEKNKQPATQKLDEKTANQLLAAMPALVGEKDDRKSFALREKSQPPPKTGEIVKQAFPPPPTAAAIPNVSGELTVTRHMPDGEVPLAPYMSITFSQPMIPVTAHEDTIAQGVPVTLSPMPKGKFRWLGTKTLMFDPEVRMPAATDYTVTVAAGTKSQLGSALRNDATFKFSTPPVQLTNYYPANTTARRDAAIFLQFDQDINGAAMASSIKLKQGNSEVGVRLATADEIKKDETVNALIKSADTNEQKGRYVVVKPSQTLNYDSSITVVVEKNAPSAEGPRKTKSEQTFSFRTFGPLKVVESRCGWDKQCPPGTPWSIQFSNPLDGEVFDPETVTIAPPLPGKKIMVNGEWMTIQGQGKGRTTYTVTLPATLKDVYDQTLGKVETRSFYVTDAYPQMFGPQGLVLADPYAARRTFDFHSINIPSFNVELYRVTPADWETYLKWMQRNPREPKPAPGRRIWKKEIKIQGSPDEMVENHIDLSEALSQSGKGHAVVFVEPNKWRDEYKPNLAAWIQATDLAVDAAVDPTDINVWVTKLKDGAPASDVKVEFSPENRSTTTDSTGKATFAVPGSGKANQMIIAKTADDISFLPENVYYWGGGGWANRKAGQNLSWMVFDDRGMYRPGEEVHFKGWLRVISNAKGGDLGGLQDAATSATYKVRDSQGNEIGKGELSISGLGGFAGSFKLPATPNLGYANLEITASGRLGSSHYHGFQIQEFRRPEYEVSATASQGPHMVGGSADVTAKAAYYAGGGLPNADVSWDVTAVTTNFTPPERDDFVFGEWRPWWGMWGGDYEYSRGRGKRGGGFYPGGGEPSQNFHFDGKTDPTGSHVLHLDFLSLNPPLPMSLTTQARITDVNRQAWAASANILVHPSELYIGIKQDRYFVAEGKPIDLKGIVVDHDGKMVSGAAANVRAVRLDWTFKKGEWKEEEVDPQECAKTSGNEPFECSFVPKEGGQYLITATVTDKKGRPNMTKLRVWVAGGKQPPVRGVEKQEVTVIPNAKEYKAGETAELLVQAPFSPAYGIMSIRRSGMVSSSQFKMTGSTTTLKVPIQEGYVPNIIVQIDLVGATERTDDDGKPEPKLPKRPAYASGQINLPVSTINRTLKVSAVPKLAKLDPGGATEVLVSVKDVNGKPVADAELAVVIVDEAVLALSGYATPDPIAAFYMQRGGEVSDYYARQYVQLARPDQGSLSSTSEGREMKGAAGGAPAPAAAPMMEQAAMDATANRAEAAPAKSRMKKADKDEESDGYGQAQSNTPKVVVRKDFNALAVFAPAVKTNAQGLATVAVKVPDNLTRYRVMVVAAAGERNFGKGESNITARMPLMVRPSAPRFLNFGDKFLLPVVVQNQTDKAMKVNVAARAENAAITDGAGREVTVPANDRVEVLIPAAAEMPGTARFQVVAASGKLSDAAEFALPVWTPATTEAFATYGEIDKGAIKQSVVMPSSVWKEFGGLDIQTSSTQLQALTDAFLYLIQYPYECAEQTSSRILGVAALKDVLTAFKADGLPSPSEISKSMERDLVRLKSLQNSDGGFAWWVQNYESWPYISIHAGHALIRAKQKGFAVPEGMIDRNKQYLRDIEGRIPHYYGIQVRRALIAYSLYVRKLMGDVDISKAKKLLADAGTKELSMESLGWLLFTMSGDPGTSGERATIRKHLANRVSETAATANWTTDYADGNYLLLASDRRADAVILEALITDTPKDELIAKVVRGLLAHQKRGRWLNTQENVFVLLALDKYFQIYEKVTPNFVAKIWFGEGLAGEQSYKGRSTDTKQIEIPMSYLDKVKKGDVVIDKQGVGRLYYRIGMNYAPSNLTLAPADYGFVVQRTYEAVDKPDDVKRMPDGSWKVKAGSMVRVKLSMVAENRRYHVALVDPLPAGFEAMNPALAVTGAVPQDPNAQKQKGAYWWWMGTWYEHQNMRDERVEAFTTLLWEGVWEYSYVARATTPGNFVVPPTKAEEMYFPETFGRAGSDRVIVE